MIISTDQFDPAGIDHKDIWSEGYILYKGRSRVERKLRYPKIIKEIKRVC